jgi:hypothetical protein
MEWIADWIADTVAQDVSSAVGRKRPAWVDLAVYLGCLALFGVMIALTFG